MNNLKNLYPCLESIRKYTTVTYETFVVAYLFSKENLERVKRDFPWVTFIESNEIRGFSENNNLALRQAKGKYCFVLNDDTEMKMDVLGGLVSTIEALPERVAIVSPKILRWNGDVQVCGVSKLTWQKALLEKLHLYDKNKNSIYVNQKGTFKTYNILGACFLIKRDIFESVGWFDERYFFCPEDIALSTLLNNMGYDCYVNSDISIIHFEGMSGKSLSRIQTATAPAARRGSIIFFSDGNRFLEFILYTLYTLLTILTYIYHEIKSQFKDKPNIDGILAEAMRNTIATAYSNKSPKEIFTKYYNKL